MPVTLGFRRGSSRPAWVTYKDTEAKNKIKQKPNINRNIWLYLRT